MKTTTDNSTAASGIEYHPYIALQCYLKDPLSVQTGEFEENQLGLRVMRQFTTACCTYCEQLKANCAHYQEANGIQEGKSGGSLASYLYNPACSVTFGYTDVHCLVLLDDFDPYVRITGQFGLPMEQAILSFCPTVASLGIDGLKARGAKESPFVDLHVLLDGGPPEVRKEVPKNDPERFEPSTHGFQKSHPLILVSRFKVGGLASLGNGLVLQRALLRKMAGTVVEIQEKLLDALDGGSCQALNELELSRDAILTLKCVFLDPQDSHDVGVMLACRNYSLCVAILSALRSITLGDLRESERSELVEEASNDSNQSESDVHERIIELASSVTSQVPNSLTRNSLIGNHAFAVSYSTLGAYYRIFEEPRPEGPRAIAPCLGFVEVHPRLSVNPGHFADVERQVAAAFRIDGAGVSRASVTAKTLQPPESFHRFFVGRHDYEFALADHAAGRCYKVLPLRGAISLIRSMIRKFREEAGPDGLDGETGLTSTAAGIVVPFPSLIESVPLLRAVAKGRHLPLVPILGQMCAGLFASKQENLFESLLAKIGSISVERVQRTMRVLGLPAPLRRSIEHLWQSFASCLADARLFDVVLDLYDAFSAIQQLLEEMCQNVPGSCFGPGKVGEGGRARSRVNQEMVGDLSGLIDALQSALFHRINLSPVYEVPDRAVHFRGYLNRLISASDVPLKSGIGLLKWCWEYLWPGEETEVRGWEKPVRIGAVTRFSFDCRAGYKHIRLLPFQSVFLAQFNMNVAQIFHPAVFIVYLHEAAHQIMEVWKRSPRHLHDWLKDELQEGRPTLAQIERRDELFAEMITHLFVFGRDCKLFERYFIARHNLQPISVEVQPTAVASSPDTTIVVRFVEVLIRGFLVSDPISQMVPQLPDRISGWDVGRFLEEWENSSHPSKEAMNEITERFLNYVERVGPFFSEFDRLWHGTDSQSVNAYCRQRFSRVFERSREMVVVLWREALRTYKSYAGSIHPWDTFSGREALRSRIDSAFATGQTDVYEDSLLKPESASGEGRKPRKYSELVLLCDLLYCYLRFCYEDLDVTKGLHVQRDSEGRVKYSPEPVPGVRGWNVFQFDCRYTGQFCCDPSMRSERLRRKISVFKMLWDLSTRQRARRMMDILDVAIAVHAAFPDLSRHGSRSLPAG